MADRYSFELPWRMTRLVEEDPAAPAWIERLPSIVDACAERWQLTPGPPFKDSYASLVLPVVRAGGSDAVLKINIPSFENEHEHAALRHWDGNGAVRLLDHWPVHDALLIERCFPGEQLWSVEDDAEATRIFAAVVRRAMKPAPEQHSFRMLSDEAQQWAMELPREYEAAGRPFDPRILGEAVEAMLTLGPEQEPQVVLHQDLHGGNILSAEREPWLIIDAKPLVGELDFDMGSLLRDRRWLLAQPGGQAIVQRRLDVLADELPIDRRRARLWAIAHGLAWGVSGCVAIEEIVHAVELVWRCR